MEGFMYLAVILAIYFIPTMIAPRGRRSGVFVLNLFFGWTVLGWAIALWSATRANEDARALQK